MAATGAANCRRKFLRYFRRGFGDPKYVAWERGYKWEAHLSWSDRLNQREFSSLLAAGGYAEIAARAIRIESRTNLLFSFEKMALRDAVKTPAGARMFAEGLFALLHGSGPLGRRFDDWCAAVAALPRVKTRVLTWPVVTVFPFLAQPEEHFFLKPMVTRRAAENYGTPIPYAPKPSWALYSRYLDLARRVAKDLDDLEPRDLIDVQSFLWVMGSDEYPD